MKFELEILDCDLEDRKKIIKIRSCVEEVLETFSDYAKSSLADEVNRLRGSIERVENEWIELQRRRFMNKLSEVLNVERDKLGDQEWHDW
jgi:hypothetical protein